MSTSIVIPVRDEVHYTQSIVAQILCEQGWDRCIIFDNGSVDETKEFLAGLDERFVIVDAAGMGIYEMWRCGLDVATEDYVAILNNDIIIAPGTFEVLNKILDDDQRVWIAYPDHRRTIAQGVALNGIEFTKGTYRHGGMCGWAFMVRRERMDWRPWVDPQLRWWGGDDDIVFTVEKRGGLMARAVGLPVDHYLEGTARFHDWLHEQKRKDLAYLRKKWNR